MRKVFHFDSPSDAYTADAAVVVCFDHRIHLAVGKFLKRRGIRQPDMIVVAGGAKTLASPRNDFEQDFIVEQIRLSIRLHACRRVILMSHSDCATYGGLARFQGDLNAEQEHHARELTSACRLVRSVFAEIEVIGCFVSFEGIWQLEPEPTVSAASESQAAWSRP